MKHRFFCCLLAIAFASVLAAPAQALLVPYSQDFEALVQTDPAALADDGWQVFGNVFSPSGGYLYGYGPFPAPNGGPAFSAIAVGEGGLAQGEQQLSVYSDYDNGDHANGNLIEANVFQEQTVGLADVGSTWIFQFEAKRGNIDGSTTAAAFIKTIDPANNFALTNFITVDMTNVPNTWDGYLLSIFIDSSLVGQILQFGALSVATNYQGSGVFYDNLRFVNLVNVCEDDEGDDEDEGSDTATSQFDVTGQRENPTVLDAERTTQQEQSAGTVDRGRRGRRLNRW